MWSISLNYSFNEIHVSVDNFSESVLSPHYCFYLLLMVLVLPLQKILFLSMLFNIYKCLVFCHLHYSSEHLLTDSVIVTSCHYLQSHSWLGGFALLHVSVGFGGEKIYILWLKFWLLFGKYFINFFILFSSFIRPDTKQFVIANEVYASLILQGTLKSMDLNFLLVGWYYLKKYCFVKISELLEFSNLIFSVYLSPAGVLGIRKYSCMFETT